MLDASDSSTFPALLELAELARSKRRPLVIWVGAGASSWCGLPSWRELAEKFYSEFSRKEPAFARKEAEELIRKMSYPEFFGVCKRVSPKRYARILSDSLQLPTVVSPVYSRFLAALQRCGPPQVITTNVDELLDRGLGIPIISQSNLEAVSGLLTEKKAFVAKLHGTIGDSSSWVFTDDEYAALVGNTSLRDVLKGLFRDNVVLFVGYGLADEHILKALTDAESAAAVFGTGPHFICSATDHRFPAPVKVIRYLPQPHKDHRSSIQVLEEISFPAPNEQRRSPQPSTPKLSSAHMLADCTPAGTWESSQRVEISGENGEEHVLYHGHGLVQSELPFHYSTALHDLVVGLVCFDRVYVPMTYLSRMHDLVGSSFFAELINGDVLRFVGTKSSDAVVFDKRGGEITGQLVEMSYPPMNSEKKERSIFDQITAAIRPAPGKEREALILFSKIEKAVLTPSDLIPISETVRSLLIRPSVRALLGMSQGTKTSVIPKWLTFPILRLATVARLGNACRELELGSVKFGVGNDKLAAPVFAATFGEAYAESVASYIVAGNFQTDLGAFTGAQPAILPAILRFRDTSAGENLRRTVLAHLAGSNGADVAASINGGLSKIVGPTALEAARGTFAKLCITTGQMAYPAAWFDQTHSDQALGLWRKRSIVELQGIIRRLGIKPYDTCPCGSGENLKFCCMDALLNHGSISRPL